MLRYTQLFLACFLCLLSLVATAQHKEQGVPLYVSPESSILLSPILLVFTDTTQDLDIRHVSADMFLSAFHPYNKSLKVTKGKHYWVKFLLYNPIKSPQDYNLYIGTSFQHKLYIVKQQSVLHESERSSRKNILFTLPPQSTTEVYIQLTLLSTPQNSSILALLEQFRLQAISLHPSFSYFLGALFCLCFWSLSFQRKHTYFSLFILFYTIYYLFKSFSIPLPLAYFFLLLSCISYLFFLNKYLHLFSSTSKSGYFQYGTVLGLVIAFLSILLDNKGLGVSLWISILLLINIYIIGEMFLHKTRSYSVFITFIIAHSILILGLLFHSLLYLGWIYVPFMSLFLQIMFLSFIGLLTFHLSGNTETQSTTESQRNITQERFELAMEVTREGVVDWNRQTQSTYFSPSNYTMLGFLPYEFAPTIENWQELIHPDDVTVYKSTFSIGVDEVLFTPQYEIQYRVRSKKGSYKWVMEKGKFIIKEIEGKPTLRIIGTRTDITKNKKKEEILEQVHQNYKNIKNALYESTLVITLDKEARIKQVNGLFCQFSQYSKEELAGKEYKQMFAKYHSPLYFKYLWKTVSEGHIWRGDIKSLAKDGSSYWMEIAINPVVNKDGEIEQYLVIGQEISSRKNIAQERKKLIKDLSQYNKDLEQFAYITSHNLRAPIASIIGLISIYDRENPNAEVNKEIISKLESSAINMDEIFKDINGILATRDKVDQVKEDINLKNLVENIKVSFEKQILNSKTQMNDDFSEIPRIYSIKNYIESILINLISNAIKYRHPDRLPVIDIKSQLHGEYICITVRDNGLGMNVKKHKDKIFGLYKRFHFHTGGKGIGLHLVKTQTEALGGNVELESKEGQGSCFSIYLPKESENFHQKN